MKYLLWINDLLTIPAAAAAAAEDDARSINYPHHWQLWHQLGHAHPSARLSDSVSTVVIVYTPIAGCYLTQFYLSNPPLGLCYRITAATTLVILLCPVLVNPLYDKTFVERNQCTINNGCIELSHLQTQDNRPFLNFLHFCLIVVLYISLFTALYIDVHLFIMWRAIWSYGHKIE